jgi:hypothetical protein
MPETADPSADLNKFQPEFEQSSVSNYHPSTGKILNNTDQSTKERRNVLAGIEIEAASPTPETDGPKPGCQQAEQRPSLDRHDSSG